MKANLMAIGAFLFVLGVTIIAAIPYLFLLYGVGAESGALASESALLSIVVASVGAALLTYGIAAKQA